METSSALLAFCAGNSPATDEFPAQRPVTRSFDVFFDLRLNKQLSKQWWGRWLETPSRSLWRQCNDGSIIVTPQAQNIPAWQKITSLPVDFFISKLISDCVRLTGSWRGYFSISSIVLSCTLYHKAILMSLLIVIMMTILWYTKMSTLKLVW